MISTLKRCLIFLALFVFSPVSANSSGDSASTAFLVLVVIVIFLFTMVCRCIEESKEDESEVMVEEPRMNERSAPIILLTDATPEEINGFRNFHGYQNVPFSPAQQPSVCQATASGYTNRAFVPGAPNEKQPAYDQPPPAYDLIEFNENARKFGQNVQRY